MGNTSLKTKPRNSKPPKKAEALDASRPGQNNLMSSSARFPLYQNGDNKPKHVHFRKWKVDICSTPPQIQNKHIKARIRSPSSPKKGKHTHTRRRKKNTEDTLSPLGSADSASADPAAQGRILDAGGAAHRHHPQLQLREAHHDPAPHRTEPGPLEKSPAEDADAAVNGFCLFCGNIPPRGT